jgi:hypothetical protein
MANPPFLMRQNALVKEEECTVGIPSDSGERHGFQVTGLAYGRNSEVRVPELVRVALIGDPLAEVCPVRAF